MRMCPAPKRPTRTAWRIVLKPLMTSAAEDGPIQVVLALICHADHDGGGEDDPGQGEHGGLEAEANG